MKLFSVFGTPTPLTYAGCAIIRELAEVASGPHAFIQANYVDDLKKVSTDFDVANSNSLVLFSDFPSTPLVEAIEMAHTPAIVFRDDIETIAHHAIETRDMSVAHALRFATQTICALARLRGAGVLDVAPGVIRRPMREFIVAAGEFYATPAPQETADGVMRRFGREAEAMVTIHDHFASLLVPREANPGKAADDPHDRALIKTVADRYAHVVAGGEREEIEWPTELFLDWDRPGAFLAGPIELVGPARFIICGPYLHLPAGKWNVEVVIEISDNLSGNRLGVDVFSGEILSGVTAPLPASGVFSFSMPLQVEDPFLPVELRFQILAGAIEGKLALRRVIFYPVFETSP